MSLVVVCVVHAIFIMILVDWDSDSTVRLMENEMKCLAFKYSSYGILRLFWQRTELLKIEGHLRIVHVVY